MATKGQLKSSFQVREEATEYAVAHTTKETAEQFQLRQETEEVTGRFAVMVSAVEQQRFIQILLKSIKAKKTLDIGTFTGYSALSAALALPEDGKVYAFDVSEEFTNIGKKYWKKAGVDNKIHLTLQPAVEALEELIQTGHAGTFDYAFIDADKSNYDTYYEKCLVLVRQGGIIVLDNVLWSGKVYDPSNDEEDTVHFKKLNDKLVKDPRVEVAMLTVADGISVCYKV